ncbi:DNA-directed DNA polymerase [Malassezia caprae]|uniref:DNA polymerase n=1 Tax=Malassezia caprae TaxID=1381934 RepID=A0AAF0E751_9BASI|nr:DNA-directed DNA polymerase [Malassezia caprae]
MLAPAFAFVVTSFEYALQAPGPHDTFRSAFGERGVLSRVPVLHAFGARSPGGERVCAHIHDVFPYCYVAYTGDLEPGTVLSYIERLGKALNGALAAALLQPGTTMHHIAAIHLCKGTPFYGYHERPQYYLKISYTDPSQRQRLAMLLESGSVLGQRMQPMEAHVPYHLQFMMDYNVFGCDVLTCDEANVRTENGTVRESFCAYEVDIAAWAIANRRAVQPSAPLSAHEASTEPVMPGLRPLWAQARVLRAQMGLDASIPTPSTDDDTHRRAASDMVWDAQPQWESAWDARVQRDKAATQPPVHELDTYVLDTFRTVELFHPGGVQQVAPEDASGQSAKMFHLEYAASQDGSLDLPPRPSVPTPTVVPSSQPHEGPSPVPTVGKSPHAPLPRAAPAPVSGEVRAWPDAPPSAAVLQATLSEWGEPAVQDQGAHYSCTADVPSNTTGTGGCRLVRQSAGLDGLPSFFGAPRPRRPVAVSWWQYSAPPPSTAQVRAWLASESEPGTQRSNASSGVSALDGEPESPLMSVLYLEVMAMTRGDQSPDATHDAVLAVVYALDAETSDDPSRATTGVVLVHAAPVRLGLGPHVRVTVVPSEQALLAEVVALVRAYDPEILAGYDGLRASWAYLVERARVAALFDMAHELGRLVRPSAARAATAWTTTRGLALHVAGRQVLDVWRVLRHEVALTQDSLEHAVQQVLQERMPAYTPGTLCAWLCSGRVEDQVRALRYGMRRIDAERRLLAATEVLARTAAHARMFGVDFSSVLARGSQFQVEAVLLRLTKPASYVLPSPTRAQVGQQNAPECLPLVLEPRSGAYWGPVLVLDFQSLYPSVMMAYNVCYSTCVGRVTPFHGTYKLGFTEHAPAPGVAARLGRHVHVAPNGLVFVRPEVRESTLARMLREVLAARVLTKQSMQWRPHDRAFQRRQNAQQQALKLLANVTYGYCGASASGRMPCVEIADAIVQYGRETLEHAMAEIEQETAWNAEIVYGDTDSLFVHLPGRSMDDAFRLGRAMAARITAMNPAPVRLRFEKVYLPCVLVAKKRYVGYRFDAPAARAVLDVKGLEMVRRDGFAAMQHMQESCVRLLFDTHDLSAVRRYCERQWTKMYAGDVSPVHLLLAKEVRLGTYASHGALPPGAAVAARAAQHDPAGAPHLYERVPYLLAQGAPGTCLADRAIAPTELLGAEVPLLAADDYVRRRMVPALARIFDVVGADMRRWLDHMPRVRAPSTGLASAACSVCGARAAPTLGARPVCVDCQRNPETSLYRVGAALHDAEVRQRAVQAMCCACANDTERPPCVAVSCAMLYERASADRRVASLGALQQALEAQVDVVPRPPDAWTW